MRTVGLPRPATTIGTSIGGGAERVALSSGCVPRRRRLRDDAKPIPGRAIILRNQMVSVAIWGLFASILVLDFTTSRENVSVCFAYVIPIFLSLFEARPRSIFYASMASVLSLAEPFVQPPHDIGVWMETGHRLAAILAQWLAAMLVRLQRHLLVAARDQAEFQHRFVDILSHEIGTAVTTVIGQAYRLIRLSAKLTPNDVVARAEKIRRAADGIQTIISRIQFASSLGDGSIPARHSSVNLHTMISDLVERLKEEQRIGCLELAPLVEGDEMLLRGAFENVIANSIKYSPSDAPILIIITGHGYPLLSRREQQRHQGDRSGPISCRTNRGSTPRPPSDREYGRLRHESHH
jgi:signal transduction histidine kinase